MGSKTRDDIEQKYRKEMQHKYRENIEYSILNENIGKEGSEDYKHRGDFVYK